MDGAAGADAGAVRVSYAFEPPHCLVQHKRACMDIFLADACRFGALISSVQSRVRRLLLNHRPAVRIRA